MRFSILIPVYNVEKYLCKCIESVLVQKFPSMEIVLLDDGSTDSSGEICDEYKEKYPQLIKVLHKQNEGLFATRRKLFEYASGDYCVCLDSDDFLSGGSLEILSKIIDESAPDFILYDLIHYDSRSGRTWRDENPLAPNFKYTDISILKTALLMLSFSNWSMCAKCIKTGLVQDILDYQKYYDISFGEDTLQSIILYNKCNNFVYCNEVIYNYRTESGMTNKLSIKYLEDFLKISHCMCDLCKLWCDNIELQCCTYMSKIYIMYLDNIYLTSCSIDEMYNRIYEAEQYMAKRNININYSTCNNLIKKVLLKFEMNKSLYMFYKIRGYYHKWFLNK